MMKILIRSRSFLAILLIGVVAFSMPASTKAADYGFSFYEPYEQTVDYGFSFYEPTVDYGYSYYEPTADYGYSYYEPMGNGDYGYSYYEPLDYGYSFYEPYYYDYSYVDTYYYDYSYPTYYTEPVSYVKPIAVSAPTYVSAPVGYSKPISVSAPSYYTKPVGYTQPVATTNTNTNTDNSISNSYNTYDYSINDSFNTYGSYNTNTTNVNTAPVYTAQPQYTATAVLPTYTYPTYPTYHPQYVTLSQLPYTGYDFGILGNILYWTALALFALAAAYLVVYYLPRFMSGKTERTGREVAHISAPAMFAFAGTSIDMGNSFKSIPVRASRLAYNLAPKDEMTFARSENGAPRIVITRG